jgi:hypothetical protein
MTAFGGGRTLISMRPALARSCITPDQQALAGFQAEIAKPITRSLVPAWPYVPHNFSEIFRTA